MQRSLSAFVLPFWLAAICAAVEVLILYAGKRASPFRHLSEDLVWMTPAALLALTAAVVLPFACLHRLGWRGPLPALALFLGGTLVAVDLLFLVPSLAPPAAAILAVGIAAHVARILLRRAEAATRIVRRTTLPMLAVVLVGGTGLWHSLRPSLAAFVPRSAGAARPPNVVFITLDTVRAGSLSLYGYGRQTTPVLERLAARGTVFDAAFSTASWTLPSHASMFTGRWPHELSTDYASPLDATFPTLAEFLTAQGYATAGFAANLGYVSHETGLGRGFQHYEDYPRSLGQIAASSTLVRTVADNFRLRRLIENDEHLNRVRAPDLSARALTWIDGHRGGPFMVFLNYFDAHEPYLPPPPFDRRFGGGRSHGRHSPLHHWLWNQAVDHGNMGARERQEEIDAYDGALAALDQDLGAFIDALQRRGLGDDAIVVVTSDHGEEFGEHGVYDHGYSLYRAGVHVPLLILAPGRAPAAHRVATPVSLRDLATTVSHLAGFGGRAPFPGASLAPLWADGPTAAGSQTSPAFFEVRPSPGQPDWFPSSKGDMAGAIVGSFHYIRNGDGREELYDWRLDPAEERDLAAAPTAQDALAAGRVTVDRARRQGPSTP